MGGYNPRRESYERVLDILRELKPDIKKQEELTKWKSWDDRIMKYNAGDYEQLTDTEVDLGKSKDSILNKLGKSEVNKKEFNQQSINGTIIKFQKKNTNQDLYVKTELGLQEHLSLKKVQRTLSRSPALKTK